jgi:hypothetical protein
MKDHTQLLTDTADRLLSLIREATDTFNTISNQEWEFKSDPKKWSKKEILGHLTDSAANNHLRFVRAQLAETEFVSFAYEQDFFVSHQKYQDYPISQLVSLWYSYNQFLAHVIRNADPLKLTVTCRIGNYEPAPLSFVLTDYVDHLHHHLDEIILKRPSHAN